MTKSIAIVFGVALTGTAAVAQTLAPDERQAPANSPYITGTGATVAHPGESQSGGTTPLDRGIQRQDNKIDSSICKGC